MLDDDMDGPDGSPAANGSKRKSEESGSQPRAKRNRYIPMACNECKRRKIKCNGNQPCQRCGNLSLECVYAPNCCGSNFKDSEEFRQMSSHISSLQEQVNALFASVSSLRSELSHSNPPLDPSLNSAPYMDAPPQMNMPGSEKAHARSPPAHRQPAFRGPMSNAFSFDVAKGSLHTMGITPEVHSNSIEDEEGGTANGSPVASPPPGTPPHWTQPWTKQTKDPIWFISRTEALRLLDIYENETHQMYPILNIAHMRAHITSLYRFLDAFRPQMLRRDTPGRDAIYDPDTMVLKLVLATVLTTEGKGRSEAGQRLWESVQPEVDALLLSEPGVQEIRLFAMTAIYQFHCDNEGTAWRIIGLTARLAVELGLHRKEAYEKMSPEEHDTAVLVFWSIYALDRRWSFGTGMPFALQDSDIDPQLPRPGELSLYLEAIIDYCAIGNDVWQSINGQGTITKENIVCLDFMIRQWHDRLPDQLRYDHTTLDPLREGKPPARDDRLKIILYFRRNNMLINLYRPVLYSATNIMQYHEQAQDVVKVAQDSVRTLTRINQYSDMWRSSQILFNAFLTSALAVLFLAVSHAPAEFSAQVRDEVAQALSLVRGFSRGSFVSKRLWKTISVLKEVGPKLGLDVAASEHHRQPDDPSRSAALAMAGLAAGGHRHPSEPVPQVSPPQRQQQRQQELQQSAKAWPNTPSSAVSALASPDVMANDLTRLFEAAGDNGGSGTPQQQQQRQGLRQKQLQQQAYGMVEGGGEIGIASEDELSRIMRDLF